MNEDDTNKADEISLKYYGCTYDMLEGARKRVVDDALVQVKRSKLPGIPGDW